MNELLKPLKSNDEVYIRRLNMDGEVLRPHEGSANEPEGERLYEVQITRYFRRTDLELYGREAERKKREASRREKAEQFAAAQKKWDGFVEAGGDINSAEAG